jgi:predicted RNA-binding Zn-ribbon protein involved in translation (DUF1610 family)
MAKTMTFDEAFLIATVRGDERAVKQIVKAADRACGKSCPDCGGKDIMDNGETSIRYLTFACKDCGQQWDAAQEGRR